MNTALIVMAAGIGSRFGGIKQLKPIDEKQHLIIDYSIHDAIAAGYNKIIIVLRKAIEAEFQEVIGTRIEPVCKRNHVALHYVFQELNDIPIPLPPERVKPWGTGHAVLAAKELIHEPFAVINADDYYGKSSLKVMHDQLLAEPDAFSMVGFILKNTLSAFGGVTRGICKVDDTSMLTAICETKNIVKTAEGAEANGVQLDVDSCVSMNLWGFSPAFVSMLEEGFKEFLTSANDILKNEFLIPIFVGKRLAEHKISVRVIPTHDNWFGITYQNDIPYVQENFRKLIASNVYASDLYSDM